MKYVSLCKENNRPTITCPKQMSTLFFYQLLDASTLGTREIDQCRLDLYISTSTPNMFRDITVLTPHVL